MAVGVDDFSHVDIQVSGQTLLLFYESLVDLLFERNTLHSTKQKTEAFL